MAEITYISKPTPGGREAEQMVRASLSGISPSHPVVIAIGGDGTMLRAIRAHMHEQAVFVGISAGSLGLLQTVNVEQLPQLVYALKTGIYHRLSAPLLQVSYCDILGETADKDTLEQVLGYGFNDISIERQDSRAAKFKLKIDSHAGNFIGDGVIFATPLGSTAYSLAAGGPIIDPTLQDIYVITPNNPHLSSLHSSLQRPHVLGRRQVVRIEIPQDDNRPVQVAVDGQVLARDVVKPIQVKVSDKSVDILQLSEGQFRRQIEEKRLGKN